MLCIDLPQAGEPSAKLVETGIAPIGGPCPPLEPADAGPGARLAAERPYPERRVAGADCPRVFAPALNARDARRGNDLCDRAAGRASTRKSQVWDRLRRECEDGVQWRCHCGDAIVVRLDRPARGERPPPALFHRTSVKAAFARSPPIAWDTSVSEPSFVGRRSGRGSSRQAPASRSGEGDPCTVHPGARACTR